MTRTLGWIATSLTGVAILTLGTADTAQAHVCMVTPTSRVGPECSARSPQKMGPCGIDERGAYITELRPGETIVVELDETVDHPSHYRISFNPGGDEFEDPVSIDDADGAHPYVLLDGIEDTEEARQSIEVTLPDIECDECTLQLIQVMYDKQGNGFGGRDGIGDDDNDDIYYSCADIVLRGEPVESADALRPDAPQGESEGDREPISPVAESPAWVGRADLAERDPANRRVSGRAR